MSSPFPLPPHPHPLDYCCDYNIIAHTTLWIINLETRPLYFKLQCSIYNFMVYRDTLWTVCVSTIWTFSLLLLVHFVDLRFSRWAEITIPFYEMEFHLNLLKLVISLSRRYCSSGNGIITIRLKRLLCCHGKWGSWIVNERCPSNLRAINKLS